MGLTIQYILGAIWAHNDILRGKQYILYPVAPMGLHIHNHLGGSTKMKKAVSILLLLLLCLSLTACGGGGTESGTKAASIPEGADITEDQLKQLAEAYNALAQIGRAHV